MLSKMLKNGLKVLILYIPLIGIAFVLLTFLQKYYMNTGSDLNNIIVKLFLILLISTYFFVIGKMVGTKSRSRYDFLSIALVAVVGIFLFLLSSLSGGLGANVKLTEASLPASIFLSPFILIGLAFDVEINIIFFVGCFIIASIIIGISIRRRRIKLRKIRRSHESSKINK